jgi:hypothetical protein
MKKLNGQDIISIRSLKSMYDQDCVAVFDDNDNEYRMPMRTILQMVNEFLFVPVQKRKYVHLTEAVMKEGDRT